jgi:hypothetical protein
MTAIPVSSEPPRGRVLSHGLISGPGGRTFGLIGWTSARLASRRGDGVVALS